MFLVTRFSDAAHKELYFFLTHTSLSLKKK